MTSHDANQAIYITETTSSGERRTSLLIKGDPKTRLQTSTPKPPNASRKQTNLYDHTLTLLKDVFLPAGWPSSVSSDYSAYQIYDSLQAFASTIAGLLSSRAVLTGIGVGDASATPTAALLLHILQDSTGRLATILFAHRLGGSLEPETKRYRLLADVFNDISIVLDCASPLLPRGVLRVSVLSSAGMLRALCGVAAGATKASLSVHFAAGGDGAGNVGELNAKDASQETVISLMGSLVGSLVVSWVTGAFWTWSVLLALLAVHLGMNARAVRAVCLRTLNRQRAGLVFARLFAGRSGATPEAVQRAERIFEQDGVVRDAEDRIIGWARIGVSIQEIEKQISLETDAQSNEISLSRILSIFSESGYILHPDSTRQTILIALAESAGTEQQLQAWAHAVLLLQRFSKVSTKERGSIPDERVLDMIRETQALLHERWDKDIHFLREQGWDLHTPSLETSSGSRYRVEYSAKIEAGQAESKL